jgi:hypothetical protein
MIPTYDELLLPVLVYLSDGKSHSLDELEEALAERFEVSGEERTQLLPSGKYPVFRSRISWAKTYLGKALLLETPKRGHYRITERGAHLLNEGYEKLDNKILSQYEEFAGFYKTAGQHIWEKGWQDNEKGKQEIEAFNNEWPISRLQQMTLEEYTNLEKTSFTYWLEALTGNAGSIWGGSSFKFLIYKRANQSSELKPEKFGTDGEYGWLAKLGDDRNEVFAKVKEEVIRIAVAAQNGDLQAIPSSLFGDAVNWKIGFLYNPEIVTPIFQRSSLVHIVNVLGMGAKGNTPIADIQTFLGEQRPEETSSLDYAKELWHKYHPDRIYWIIESFLQQAQEGTDLSTSYYPKKYQELNLKVSFGKGSQAKVPWICLPNENNTIQEGIYPAYLYFKEHDILILAFGISETKEPIVSWPAELLDTSIDDYFQEEFQVSPHRYGGAYVFKAYPVADELSPDELQADIDHLTSLYKKIDFSEAVEEELDTEEGDDNPQFWIIAPGTGARFWEEWQNKGIITIGWDHLEDLNGYETQEDIAEALRKHEQTSSTKKNDSKACFDFSRAMKEGDLVIVKTGRHTLLGVGEIQSGYLFDPDRIEHKHYRRVEWATTGNWETEHHLAQKTLTYLTPYPEYVQGLLTSMQVWEEKATVSTYSMENLLNEVFLEKDEVSRIARLLEYKKNIILQGPPGTGKTFLARRLAYAMMGQKDKSRVQMIQFHQSYAYEDFIQGFRPNEKGQFELANGIFYRFCKEAQKTPDQPFFFIIDEINRGNLSKIFGELMLLIEHDKRGPEFKIPLTYSKQGTEFYIPENVHIIGTMNTADRSLAMVDYALRRRFAFIDLDPQFNGKFKAELKRQQVPEELIAKISVKLEDLNKSIAKETDLGKGFMIGHSYFCNVPDKPNLDWWKQIIQSEIQPLLEEYWFDKPQRVEAELDKLA